EIVGSGFPAVFAVDKKESDPAAVSPDQRRGMLAKWVVSPKNPLAARVLVNRIWGWHFGQGIVRTPNDFGAQGQPPTHPELLDWLAAELIRNGWRLKPIHKLLMTSAAYAQSGETSPAALKIDPQNTLCGRVPPRRLEAD